MLDTIKKIETPEGVTLNLRLAGPVTRFLAWSADFGIKFGIFITFGSILPLLGKFGVGLFLIVFFLTWWIYGVYYEAMRNGMTPGKKMMGIRVVYDNGTPIGWSAAFSRNLLRAVDILPFMYTFGLISILLNKDFKRIGDLATGTIVVYADSTKNLGDIPKRDPATPAFSLSLDHQHAIVDFAERTRELSDERVIEIAMILKTLTQKEGEQGVEMLLQYANWIVGRR